MLPNMIAVKRRDILSNRIGCNPATVEDGLELLMPFFMLPPNLDLNCAFRILLMRFKVGEEIGCHNVKSGEPLKERIRPGELSSLFGPIDNALPETGEACDLGPRHGSLNTQSSKGLAELYRG